MNMKIIKRLFLFGMIASGFISCKNKTESVSQIDTGDVSEESNDSIYQACGVVIDATMNGFTMVTPKNDTLYISTMDKDLALEGGLLLGDTLDVSYTTTEDGAGINLVSTAKKIHY